MNGPAGFWITYVIAPLVGLAAGIRRHRNPLKVLYAVVVIGLCYHTYGCQF